MRKTFLVITRQLLVTMILISMGGLLCVFILSKDVATGVVCADFLIHSKQKNQLANSFSLCRYLRFALVLENVIFGSLTQSFMLLLSTGASWNPLDSLSPWRATPSLMGIMHIIFWGNRGTLNVTDWRSTLSYMYVTANSCYLHWNSLGIEKWNIWMMLTWPSTLSFDDDYVHDDI